MNASRTVDIMSDSAHWILTQDSSVSGNCFVDEDIITNADKLGRPASTLDGYRYRSGSGTTTTKESPLMPDFFHRRSRRLRTVPGCVRFRLRYA